MKILKNISLVILSVIGASILILYSIDLKPSFNNEVDFSIKGIDISHHNKINNWSNIKNEIGFCYIKSTEGSTYIDPNFKTNWLLAKKHNIKRGAYHYFFPGVPAEKQFNNFKNHVQLSPGDLPPVLDVELKESNMNEVTKWLELATKYYKIKPILYTEFIFFKVYMDGKVDNQYPLWIYIDKSFGFKPSFNNYNCVLWQFSHKGKVDGITGDVDLDSFLGDSLQFKSMIVK
jgi:lysozyme